MSRAGLGGPVERLGWRREESDERERIPAPTYQRPRSEMSVPLE